jgi:hypothetical protein
MKTNRLRMSVETSESVPGAYDWMVEEISGEGIPVRWVDSGKGVPSFGQALILAQAVYSRSEQEIA